MKNQDKDWRILYERSNVIKHENLRTKENEKNCILQEKNRKYDKKFQKQFIKVTAFTIRIYLLLLFLQ